MLELQTGIADNGMTRMHVHWGGTHDSLLGFLFWMYDIPSYSFHEYMFPSRIMVHDSRKSLFTNFLKKHNSIFVHHVICANQFSYNQKNKNFDFSGRVACQYDIADMIGDDIMYKNHSFLSIEQQDIKKYYNSMKHQWQAGIRSSKALNPISNQTASQIRRTIFKTRAENLQNVFEPFTPFDCPLLT